MAKKAFTDVNRGWLFSEEPDHSRSANLEANGNTVWNGVDNNLAR